MEKTLVRAKFQNDERHLRPSVLKIRNITKTDKNKLMAIKAHLVCHIKRIKKSLMVTRILKWMPLEKITREINHMNKMFTKCTK